MTRADDCFASIAQNVLHAEACALLSELAVPADDYETANIFAASGRVCAETVIAPRPIPAHTNAAVDGYAFAFADYDRARGAVLPVADKVAAGDARKLVSPLAGAAVRIFTGAVMPAGCDAVAMQEDCRIDSQGAVHIPAGLKRGANRRLEGEDIARGDAILVPGHRLRPQDAASLAASGRSDVLCFKKPRVCIFSTGNEVLAPGAHFREGHVYDANGPMLAGLLSPIADASFQGVLLDRAEAVREALAWAATCHDVVVTSGGASLGDEDHVIAALKAKHALRLWQLAIKPGRPLGVGKIDSCLFFALPGNPVAVMVGALLYLWPAVRRRGGESWKEPVRLSLPSDFEIGSRRQGRREFLRGWLEDRDGQIVVRKFERDGSGLISSLRAATGLVEIAENQTEIRRGDKVNFIPFFQFGFL